MEEKTYKFSIVTVCYNSAHTIGRTIQSLINQTNQDFEYIIVDGNSSDSTLQIIEKFRDFFGARLRVVSEPDHGIYDAMNKGIRMATGSIIGIINSDDYYESDALQIVSDNWNGDPNCILYGMSFVHLENGDVASVDFHHHNILEQAMISHPASFVTKNVYRELQGYSLEYKSASDYDFMLRAKERGVCFLPIYKVLSNFYSGGMSSSLRSYEETSRVWKRHKCISSKRYYYLCIKLQLLKVKRFLNGIANESTI